MWKRSVTSLLLLAACITVTAQIPPGYYDSAAGLSGQALHQALHNIIDDHTVIPYDELFLKFQSTDSKAGSVVWDMYSDVPGGTPPYVYHYNAGDECGNYSTEGDCYNREHSWPKSWFGGEVYPMYSDLFHLYPTDGYVNNRRGNFPFGEVSATQWVSLNGSKVGDCSAPGYSGTVFEPIDAYKGDFARSYFYMSVRYLGEDAAWPGSNMTTGAQLQPWALNLLMLWDQQDTVSQKERDRNEAVYLFQGNRNPFIDHPEWVDLIWGVAGMPPAAGSAIRLRAYPNPARDKVTLYLDPKINTADAEVQLVNCLGIIKISDGKFSGNQVMLDLSGLEEGIYLLRLSLQGQLFQTRIVHLSQ